MLNKPKIIAIAAYSGTGKTTLLKQLIPQLSAMGLRCAVIKHAHHHFEVDKPGKDSFEVRKAGAAQVLISSANRFVNIKEQQQEYTLKDCLAHVDKDIDLVIVEGYKHERIKKIELYRCELNNPRLYINDPHVIAIAAPKDEHHQFEDRKERDLLDLNDIRAFAQYIVNV